MHYKLPNYEKYIIGKLLANNNLRIESNQALIIANSGLKNDSSVSINFKINGICKNLYQKLKIPDKCIAHENFCKNLSILNVDEFGGIHPINHEIKPGENQ